MRCKAVAGSTCANSSSENLEDEELLMVAVNHRLHPECCGAQRDEWDRDVQH